MVTRAGPPISEEQIKKAIKAFKKMEKEREANECFRCKKQKGDPYGCKCGEDPLKRIIMLNTPLGI